MFAGNCLLCIFLGNLVGFGGDHGDEFDAAFYEQVASLLGERHSLVIGQYFGDDLLDGGCVTPVSRVDEVVSLSGRRIPLGRVSSSLPVKC